MAEVPIDAYQSNAMTWRVRVRTLVIPIIDLSLSLQVGDALYGYSWALYLEGLLRNSL